MSEVLLGKLIDIAFTASFTKLNRDEVASEARTMVRNGATMEDVTNWLISKVQDTEDAAQQAIDNAPE